MQCKAILLFVTCSFMMPASLVAGENGGPIKRIVYYYDKSCRELPKECVQNMEVLQHNVPSYLSISGHAIPGMISPIMPASPMISPVKNEKSVDSSEKKVPVVARKLFEERDQFDERQHQRDLNKAIANADLRRSQPLAQIPQNVVQKKRTPLSGSVPSPQRPILKEAHLNSEMKNALREVFVTCHYIASHARKNPAFTASAAQWEKIDHELRNKSWTDFIIKHREFHFPADVADEACDARKRVANAVWVEKKFSSLGHEGDIL